MSHGRFPECADCAFYGVEPAVCDECEDANQFEESDPETYEASGAPIYFSPTRKVA